MNPNEFQNPRAGKVVRSMEGYWTFVPNPLPPNVAYTTELVNLLSEADAHLGRLVGAGQILSNPYLLIYPYISQEAVLSSRIEGTQASLSDLYLFETASDAPMRHSDVIEVRNYVQALQWGLGRLNELPLSLRLVRELHAHLMEGVRGSDKMPGEFRREQNWIGPPGCTRDTATYVPPPVREMEEALNAWEKSLHAHTDLPPLIQAALIHYQFEAIHPFLDGNGRVGRLLIILFLQAKGRLQLPLLYLSAFFERYRSDYYRHLLAVSQKGEWEDWIKFFLRGVRNQSRNAFVQSQHILHLRDEYQERARERAKTSTVYRMIDSLFRNPVVTARDTARRLQISEPAARNVIGVLVEANILTETTGKTRYRVYMAKELLSLLETDPAASPSSSDEQLAMQTEFSFSPNATSRTEKP